MSSNGQGLALPELLTHAAWLRRLAVTLVRDPDAAEDVVQSTLVAAWSRPPGDDQQQARDVRDLRPWLAEVARNQAHDLRRSEGRRKVRQEIAAGETGSARPETPSTPEQLIGDLEIHRTVAELMIALPEPYRETMVLHFYEGISSADIARRLGTPAGTIRWRLKEGIARLRVALDRRHGGDRGRWQRALLPLTPAGAAGAPLASAGEPSIFPPSAPAVRAGLIAPVAALVALVLAVGSLLAVTFWPDRPAVERPGDSVAGAPARSARPEARPTALPAPVPRFALPASGDENVEASTTRVGSERVLNGLLAAIADDDYDAFLMNSDDLHKAVFGKDLMKNLAKDLGPHLRAGYQALPLGTVKKVIGKIELQAYVWKLVFRDGSEDVLVLLGLRDGLVLSFHQE